MAIHVFYVVDFGDDCIEVSDRLPKDRQLPFFPGSTIPVFRQYKLTQLRVEAEEPPLLPDGEISEAQYQEWRTILDPDALSETVVDRHTISSGLAGLCVDAKLAAVDAIPHGTLLEVNVTNVGPYPVGEVQVVWHGRWEKPDEAGIIGRGFSFVPVGKPPKELQQGDSRLFVLMQPQLQQGLSYAAALDPDQFHISVNAALPGQYMLCEVARITGQEMAYMIQQLEHCLETEEPQ